MGGSGVGGQQGAEAGQVQQSLKAVGDGGEDQGAVGFLGAAQDADEGSEAGRVAEGDGCEVQDQVAVALSDQAQGLGAQPGAVSTSSSPET